MRDISDKADNVGDTLKAEVFNINKNELQHVVETGGAGLDLDPEGGPDSDEYMLSKSIATYGGGGEYYACSGISPLYQLSRTTLKFPNNYFTGLQILFVATFENEAAPQVQIGTLGSVDLKQPDESVIPNGYIKSGSVVEALYVTNHFKMINFVPARVVQTPRLDFIYTTASGVNGVAYNSGSSPFKIPISNTPTFNSIAGASIASNQITLQRGYIYDVDIIQTFDDVAVTTGSKTRVYLADPASPSTVIKSDLSNENRYEHASHIKGLLDLKTTPPATQTIALYIHTTNVGTSYAGLAVNNATLGINEKYTVGTILQTGY